MRFANRLLALVAATLSGSALLALSSGAWAACPQEGAPSTSVCKSYSGVLMPSAEGVLFAPLGKGMGTWVGAGAELVLFTWSSNSDGFGPGQGKIRFDVAGLASNYGPAMVMYRGGAAVSFEGNAGRSFLIPYWGGAVGGFHESKLGGHGFVDAELGLYLLYVRGLIIDAEGGFTFPFTDFDALAGPKTQLTVSFSFW
jgi:hypothetical protein